MKIDTLKSEVVIPRPLEQQVLIGRGFFDLKLLQKKAMSVGEYKKTVEATEPPTRGKSTEAIEKDVV
jgi:hypothetical protein